MKRMWTGLKSLVAKNKVEWVAGRGRLEGPGRVCVTPIADGGTPRLDDERILSAADVILATGSRARSLPGLEADGVHIITSDDALRLTRLPQSITIIGAGAVGSEFASMFNDFGVKVTLVEYMRAIVPLEDRDVSRELERSFGRRGIEVLTNARIDMGSVVTLESGVRIRVAVEDGEEREITSELALVAAGRAANVENIGLETTRVETNRGIVKVDGFMRTAEPHVWAIGDLVGSLQLAHTAAHEGLLAVHTICGDRDLHPMDYVAQPRATYCRPEIASVGLTEQQCEGLGTAVKVGKVPFLAIAKAVIAGEPEGFAKIISSADSGKVLGVHVIGPHATDLIAESSVALQMNAGAMDIAAATHPHPTLSEVMAEAAMAVSGCSINF